MIVECTIDQANELLDKILIPKGYIKDTELTSEPVWYKVYDLPEYENDIWVEAIITNDLRAEVMPVVDCHGGIWVKDYYKEYDDLERLISIMREAREEVKRDLDEVIKIFQDVYGKYKRKYKK